MRKSQLYQKRGGGGLEGVRGQDHCRHREQHMPRSPVQNLLFFLKSRQGTERHSGSSGRHSRLLRLAFKAPQVGIQGSQAPALLSLQCSLYALYCFLPLRLCLSLLDSKDHLYPGFLPLYSVKSFHPFRTRLKVVSAMKLFLPILSTLLTVSEQTARVY